MTEENRQYQCDIRDIKEPDPDSLISAVNSSNSNGGCLVILFAIGLVGISLITVPTAIALTLFGG